MAAHSVELKERGEKRVYNLQGERGIEKFVERFAWGIRGKKSIV